MTPSIESIADSSQQSSAVDTKNESDRRENEAMFRQMLDSTNDAVVTMNATGVLTSWNRSAEKIFGWTAAEAVGKQLSALMIPPNMREKHEAGRARVISGGNHKILNRQVEMSALRKDGREIPIELSVWPVKLDSGTVFGAFIRDITARHFAEAALRASEQRLRHVIDNVKEGILVVQSGRIVFANPHTEHMLGRSLAEMQSRPFTEAIHPDDQAMVKGHYERRLRGEYVEPKYAFRICAASGNVIWVELSAVMLEWDGRAATLSFLTDITERKRLEDNLTRSLSERETILQSSIVGIAFLNTEGRVHWANRVIQQMFRGKEINYSGHSLEQYFATREEYLGVGTDVMTAIRQGKSYETEMQLKRADGTRFWAYLSCRAVNAGDATHGTVWVVMDITSRKQLEENLRISKERYQSVVDNVTEGMIVVQNNRFTFANPAFLHLLGYENHEIADLDFSNVIFSDDAPTNADVAIAIPSWGRGEQKFDTRLIHKTGALIWVQVSAVEVDWHGSSATLSFISDITRRRQAEDDIRLSLEKQKELNLLKSRFVAMTSHEFRTPLATILSSAELLKYYSEKMPPEERTEVIASIETAVKRMTRMLDDILLIGKVEAEKVEFNPQPLYLDGFCSAILGEANAVAAGQKSQLGIEVEIVMEVMAEQMPFMLDEKLMRQILGNLLSNAIKYSSAGGLVKFGVISNDENIIFSVADNGIGMSKDDLPRLFETFFRASNVGNISGTGLGLSIVKHSVNLHGGHITVESELGVGTTFIVTIPRVVAQSANVL